MKDLDTVLLSISSRQGATSALANDVLVGADVDTDTDVDYTKSEKVAELCDYVGIEYTEDVTVLSAATLRYLEINMPENEDELDLPLNMDLVADARLRYLDQLEGTQANMLAMLYSEPRMFNSSFEDNYAFASLLLERGATNPPALWRSIVTFKGRVLYA